MDQLQLTDLSILLGTSKKQLLDQPQSKDFLFAARGRWGRDGVVRLRNRDLPWLRILSWGSLQVCQVGLSGSDRRDESATGNGRNFDGKKSKELQVGWLQVDDSVAISMKLPQVCLRDVPLRKK